MDGPSLSNYIGDAMWRLFLIGIAIGAAAIGLGWVVVKVVGDHVAVH